MDYLLGKADPKLYAPKYRSPNLSSEDWQKRWEIFSNDGCGFTWYGVDAKGNIAEFNSEGSFVPEAFFQTTSANRELANFFDNLPEVSVSIISGNLRPELKNVAQNIQGANSFWQTGANQGLFIFNDTDVAGFKDNNWKPPYELLLIPERPLSLVNLPAAIQDLLKPYKFGNLEFANCQFLDISRYLYCED